MPEISRFLGIDLDSGFAARITRVKVRRGVVIEVHLNHEPVGLLAGALSPRALALAMEWATIHREELLENWRRLSAHESARRIAPLE